MNALDSYRQENPQYAHIPDVTLGPALYNKYYSTRASREQFNSKVMQYEPIQPDIGWDTISTVESQNNPNAVGPKTKYGRAKGDMQVLDMTAKAPGFGVKPAKDNSPEERHRVGVEYWGALKQHFKGDARLAAMAYNGGVGYIEDWIKRGADWATLKKEKPQTADYVKKVWNTYKQQQGAGV